MYKGTSTGRKIIAALVSAMLVLAISLTCTQPALAFDKVTYANADPNKYYVEVDLTNKIITVFEKGEKSKKYDKKVKQFICTIGTDATPTPPGSFKFNEMRRRFGYFTKFDVYAQYWINVAGGIYFHSILYTQPKEGYFTSTSFQALGGQASHGCIRMLVEDIRWMYYNIPAGTAGLLTYGEKNDDLRWSLIPTIKPSQYHPSKDEYEATQRGLPKALLKRDASFTSTAGKTSLVKKNTAVDVVSSGKLTCRVRVAGVEGHIETKNLNFLPNGPKDQKNLEKTIKEAQGNYKVQASKAAFYQRANLKSDISAYFGKGTEVEVLNTTKSFYYVKVDGETGFILKKDLAFTYGSKSDSPYVKRIEVETPAPVDHAAEDAQPDEEDMIDEL